MIINAVSTLRQPLPDLAVVQFQGADALTFLHGQISNDLLQMPATQAQLACYCSAKGRVLATMVVWREPAEETCYALVQADLAQALVKRLAMFVLRAKVRIQVLARTVTGEMMFASPAHSPAWTLSQTGDGVRIQAPSADATHGRCWHIALVTETSATIVSDTARYAWQAADIAAGLPWVSAANQDLYIPQTLNLDLLGAINFRKGCFPGQEVVARSHYRGTIKRRMVYGTVHAQPEIGMDIFQAKHGDQACGRVINLAQTDDVWHILLEAHLSDLPDADFRLARVDGAAVTLRALPYPLQDKC